MFTFAQLGSSYVINLTAAGGGIHRDRWSRNSFAIQWNLNGAVGGNISGARSVADVMAESFGTWMNAPNASISISRGANTSVNSAGWDGVNLICFTCAGDFTKEPESLAVTITTTALGAGGDDKHGGSLQFAGQILDADILFNPNRNFTTTGPATDTVQDLQTVATHEIGHFLGLSHSGVVRAVMFPYSPDDVRTLSYDDAAGIAANYPASGFAPAVITGTVRLGSNGVFGAHVYAEPVTTATPFGNLRRSPVGTLSTPGGTYRIEALPPDSYIVIAEPLDLPMEASNVEFYAKTYGQGVQTNFTTRWH